jgi:beta-lactamase class A
MLKGNKLRKSFSLLTVGLVMIIYITVQQSVESIKVAAAPPNKSEVSGQVSKTDDSDKNKIDAIAEEKIEQKKLIEIQQEQKQEKLDKLENEIKVYLGSSINNIGLSYYDINSGMQMVINGDNTFIAGSTIKVQMNMVLSDLFYNGQASENETLKYTEDCYEEGTGILQGTDLSNPFPIMLLSEYSITHSDNIATNMIIDRIGYENLKNSVDTKLGHATDHSGNYITPNDETKLLKILYENSTQNPYYPEIIKNMKNTDFHERIDLYIPNDIVAHKIGDYGNYVNDVGIIYTKQPYILSVYTNELVNASEVIAHISKMIYDYQN